MFGYRGKKEKRKKETEKNRKKERKIKHVTNCRQLSIKKG